MNKKIITLFFLVFIGLSSHSQELTTFILVRHSEKADDGTQNPPLNELGRERSESLAALLSNQEIAALYSTPFRRTQETLRPIANQKGLEVQSYDPYAKDEWLKELNAKHSGGSIVIAGHSNTIPNLANILLGEEKFEQFDESDYSNLIIIVAAKVGRGKLVRLVY